MTPVVPFGSELPPSPPDSPSQSTGGSPIVRVSRALRRGEWRLLWLIVALFILRDLPWRLDEYDQAKQAFTSLEMVEAGHWGFQHTPGSKAIATKPPLVGWFSAGLYYLTGGHWDLAWRLPSLIAALILVALLWRAGERLWPGWGGTLAAAAFALNQLTPRLAALVRTDMPLTLWITLLGLIVWRHARNESTAGALNSWSTGASRALPFVKPEHARWLAHFSPDRWAVFLLLVAAMMTKGPVVYAFLLPGMVAYTLILRRRAKKSRTTVTGSGIWGGWWHWTLPLLPFLFWLERGMVTVPGFRDQVVMHEFLGRFTVGEEAVHHNQPVYFYIVQLLGRWAPWSILLIAVRMRRPWVWWSLWRVPGNLWLVCWAVGGLLTLSLVPSKRVDRIFPVVPPLCLLLVAALRRAEEAGTARQKHGGEGMLPALSTNVIAEETRETILVPAVWPRAWSHFALWIGVALATGGAIYGAGQAYWQRADALSRFGAQVLAIAGTRRVEVVTAKSQASDETLLLYLRRLELFTPAQALQFWTTDRAEALVFSQPTLESARDVLALALPLDRPALVSTAAGPGQSIPGYTLVMRDPNTPPLTVPLKLPPPTEETPSPHKRGNHKKKP